MANSKSRFLIHALAIATLLTPGVLLAAEPAGAYMDDAAITAKVKGDILADDGLKAATDIKVDTTHSVVSLTGMVKSHAEAREAERVAAAVHGVSSVRNDIVVQPH
jgi:hyperosmotically inducible protein